MLSRRHCLCEVPIAEVLARGGIHLRRWSVPAGVALLRGQPGKATQRFRHFYAAGNTGDDDIDHDKGRMEVPLRLQLLDGNAGFGELLGIGDALVTQRIEFRGDDKGGRQPFELAAERRDAWIGTVGR